MAKDTAQFRTEPAWAPLGDLRASAMVEADAGRDAWMVTLAISRAPGDTAVDAQLVQVGLSDAVGTRLPFLERAAPGPELSEEMRIVTEMVFWFRRTRRVPAAMTVTHGPHVARLTVRSCGES